jgi:hypothetical protein
MLGASLERLGGLFDRAFLVAYWSPVFVGVALAMGIVGLVNGFTDIVAVWGDSSGAEQVIAGIAIFIGITVLAYLFSVLTLPLIQLYEGYWSERLSGLSAPFVIDFKRKRVACLADMAKQRTAGNRIPPEKSAEFLSMYQRLSSAYPRNPILVKPTRLGNVLVAAEEYPQLRYNMDAVVWWPRLVAVLPEAQQAQVDASMVPLVALLNLTTILVVVGVGGGAWLLFWRALPEWSLPCAIGGVALAWVCYRVAATQAVRFGDVVRATFDLYRLDLLKQMHIGLGAHATEREAWGQLTEWLYYGDPTARAVDYQRDESKPDS